jgi:hypothetical protein
MNARKPEMIGTERGILDTEVRMRALNSIADETVMAKTIIKTSSSDAFLYFPPYREKDVQTKNETIAARRPNLKISVSISGGIWPSNLSEEANHEAESHEAPSASARPNRFLEKNICFSTEQSGLSMYPTASVLG